jgi:predicted nuclease of restriction endonuclease-like (RecB) superfamily
MSSVPAD